MAFNLISSVANLWVRTRKDSVPTDGDLTSQVNAGALEQFNPDIGLGSTLVAVDGDLQAIDTSAEVISLDPAAQTSGAANVKYSIAFLFRWLIKLIQSLASRYESVATPLVVRLSTGTAAIALVNSALVAVPRTVVLISDTMARPPDTTAYAINDSLSNSTTVPVARTFANASLTNATGGRIVRATLTTSQSTFTGAIRLHLYKSDSIPAAFNDNAASTMSPTNWLGFIDFSGAANEGTGCSYMEGVLSSIGALDFITGATTSLFGLYTVKVAFTPTNAQTFTLTLYIDQS